MKVALRLPSRVYAAAREHLLPRHSSLEQGGFVLTRCGTDHHGDQVLDFVEWIPLEADDYAHQYDNYLELTDITRARIIKRAHDLDACLLELHSHPTPFPAAFSLSDLHGFQEFVPHVRWRLRGRPYAAIVLAPSGFDGLAWIERDLTPLQLCAIETETETYQATKLTLRRRPDFQHGTI